MRGQEPFEEDDGDTGGYDALGDGGEMPWSGNGSGMRSDLGLDEDYMQYHGDNYAWLEGDGYGDGSFGGDVGNGPTGYG